MGCEHVALFDVGHKVAFALMKTNQHRAFFAHKAHRQARPVAVAPSRALDGAHHGLGFDLADVPEVVFQHALLYRHLGAGVQVLHLAAATRIGLQTEMRAGRAHALGRLDVDFGQCALLETAFAAVNMGADHLERERAVNKNDFAVGAVGYALGFKIKGFDGQPAFGQGGGGGGF